jgi:hypothetical protein
MKWFGKSAPSFLLSFGVGVFSVIFCLFALPLPQTYAQWRFSSFGKEYDAADNGEVNAGAYVDRTSSASIVSLACQISPIIYFCSEDPVKIGVLQQKSVIGVTSKIIASTFNEHPASTYAFIQDMGQTLGFIPKQTYAQGIGFSGMAPLLPLWKAFRNVAYGLLALVMIVIGFMVMLRKKIDPKTVVTVQNALPRIVITLLLITFSYAIVGIVIDLMYVIILILLSLFESTKLLTGPSEYNTLFSTNITNQQTYTQGNLTEVLSRIRITPWQILGVPIQTSQTGLGDFFVTLLSWIPGGGAVVGMFLTAKNILQTGTLITDPGRAIGQFFGAGILGGLSMPLLYGLFSLAMIFIFIRLLILFVSAYIQIVLSLLFGPIQILFEAIPGSTSFSSWLKNLVANVAVFPVGAAMFMLANVFVTFANSAGGEKLWTPPYMGLLNNTTAIGALIAIGILFTIPSIAGQIKEALKAKPVAGGGGGGAFGQVTSSAMQIYQFWQSKEQMKSLSKLAGATQQTHKTE